MTYSKECVSLHGVDFPLRLMTLSSLFLSVAVAALPGATVSGLSDAQRIAVHRSNSVHSLHEAAVVGDYHTLSDRLQGGADPNEFDEFGYSPLHLAARGKSLKVVRLLLDAGADVCAADAHGRTPLQLCAHEDLRPLLEAAMDKRRREMELDAQVRCGDEAAVRAALAEGVNPDALAADKAGRLLHSAVESGQHGVLRVLLEEGADADLVSPDGRHSALHLAARRGDAAAIRLLLAAGADPMLPAGNRAYALHEAVWNRHAEAVKALLPAYAAVNFSPDGAHNSFPVNLAMSRGGVPFVQLFLEAGLDPDAPCLRREPPLIRAAREGRADIVRLLLDAGADKGVRDSSGKTAADYAPAALLPLLR